MRAQRHDARAAGDLALASNREAIAAQRRHLLRAMTKTAVATVVLGVIFLLTGDRSLQNMAPFLFAWSVGWGLASVSLGIQRRVKPGRRSDER
jgi:hypothetical protein